MKTKSLLSASGIASLLTGLGATAKEVADAATVVADIEIAKATAPVSTALKPSEVVEDRWQAGHMHSVPGSDKIKTGPNQQASGGGAEKMVADYSHPAPQTHLTEEAHHLAQELGSLRGYLKSSFDTVGTAIEKLAAGHGTLTNVLTAMLTKSASEEEGAVPGEAEGFAALHTRQANQFMRAAKSVLAKARQIQDGLDEAPDQAARKAAKGQFRDLRKRAARLGLSALSASYAAKSEDADPAADVRKSLHDMMEEDRTLKADIAALHDKDREKDEEKRAKKSMKKMAKKAAQKIAKKAAKKAADEAAAAATGASPAAATGGEATKSDDKGHQADKQDPGTKNQDDSAKKALPPEILSRVEAALKGVEPLTGSVQQIMELLQNRPMTDNARQPLALMKADAPADTLMAIDQRIEDADAKGYLDQAGVMRARDLLQKVTLVKAGSMSEEMWKSHVKQSPVAVQEIFQLAAA